MAGDFGTRFMPQMTMSVFDQSWGEMQIVDSNSISLHPGAHVFHYASTCFEGLKAFQHKDGSVKIFRMDKNLERLRQSSELLCLPDVDKSLTEKMINEIVHQYRAEVPAPPASMYIRPTHMGTEAAIGKAAAPSDSSMLFILLSPVGDYFSGGEASLRLLLDDVGVRCGPDHGMVKGGGNYASALKHIVRAQKEHNAQQVLFCPDGDVQETGAANFVFVDGDSLVTKSLDDSFLHGVTRESILTLARDKGLKVEERDFSVEELLERCSKPDAEAGLSGTAAVLAAVTTFIYKGKEYQVGKGEPGPRIREMRSELNAIQWGEAEDKHNWLHTVESGSA